MRGRELEIKSRGVILSPSLGMTHQKTHRRCGSITDCGSRGGSDGGGSFKAYAAAGMHVTRPAAPMTPNGVVQTGQRGPHPCLVQGESTAATRLRRCRARAWVNNVCGNTIPPDPKTAVSLLSPHAQSAQVDRRKGGGDETIPPSPRQAITPLLRRLGSARLVSGLGIVSKDAERHRSRPSRGMGAAVM